MNVDRERVAVHEAGHVVVAEALDIRPQMASIKPTAHSAGWALHAQIPRPRENDLPGLYPPLASAGLRRSVEQSVCISLAGMVAEEIYYPDTGFTDVAEPPSPRQDPRCRLTAAELRTLDARAVALAQDTDDDRAWRVCQAFAGPLAAPFRVLQERIVWQILHDHEKYVQAVAAELVEHEVVGRKRLREMLEV